jgi:LacI family transcriptional regulator
MNAVPTLRDIAAAANVSLSTVSRALRNYHRLSPQTCQRIQALAESMGYKPNPMVSALMTHKRRSSTPADWQTLAFVTAYPSRNGWKEAPIFVEFFEGARQRAEGYGYRLEEFWLREPRMTSRRFSQILYTRGVQGVLLPPLPASVGHLSLDWQHFCVAAIGYTMTRPQIHRAVHNNLFGMQLLLRQLQKLGYRRIGLAMHTALDIRVGRTWSAGFAQYLLSQRPKNRVQPFLVKESQFKEPQFAAWLKSEQPDAVVTAHTTVLMWMQRAGIQVPEDAGFAILDRPGSLPHISGINQNSAAIGAAAVDLIVGQINRNERGVPTLPKITMINGYWVSGSTLRPAITGPKAELIEN